MKQRESYRVPLSSWKHGYHSAPPLLSEIMPKHDENGGNIGGKNIGGQLGLVCIDSDATADKKAHIFCQRARRSAAYRIIVIKIKE